MKFSTLALLMISTSIFSAEIKVLDIPVRVSNPSKVNGVLRYNEILGRAWVEITVEEVFSSDELSSGTVHRAKVEGLSFDPQFKTVNLEIDGQILECAAVKQTGISVFRRKYLKNTNCSFKSKVVTVDYDNGFEIVELKRLQVFLTTK